MSSSLLITYSPQHSVILLQRLLKNTIIREHRAAQGAQGGGADGGDVGVIVRSPLCHFFDTYIHLKFAHLLVHLRNQLKTVEVLVVHAVEVLRSVDVHT